VSDPAHHRKPAGVNCARDDFFVESPQVLDAAAAAADDQHVALGAGIRGADCRRDLRACARALHRRRIDDHRDRRHAALERGQHIAQAAACSDVTTPIARGNRGSGCLAAGSNSPSACSLALSFSNAS